MTRSWTLGGGNIFKIWRIWCSVFTEDIQYLEPFTFLYAAALAVEPVVKLRLVVLPSCDVYKELIYVYDFVLKLQLFVQKTDHDLDCDVLLL